MMDVMIPLLLILSLTGAEFIIINNSSDVAIVCKTELIRCLCGNATDTVSYVTTTALTSCLDDVSLTCIPCKTFETTRICGKFELCKNCGDGLDRCLNCPKGKYGQWCDKDCPCLNNGACDDNGKCVCQHGYAGDRCEILLVTDSDVSLFDNTNATDATPISTTSRRVKRQVNVNSKVQCPMISVPENGWAQLDTLEAKPATVANYGCKEGFTMIGSRTRYCLPNGLWSGEAPTCEHLCSYPLTSPNLNAKINPNRVDKTSMYDASSNEILLELEFYCDPGYVLNGAKLVRCASGIWDHDIPTCRIQLICQDPGEVVHGSRKMVGVTTVNSMYQVGTQIVYQCDSGYVLIGKGLLTCTPFGYWSSSLPLCMPSATIQCQFNCKSLSETQQLKQPLQCKVASQNDIFMLFPGNS